MVAQGLKVLEKNAQEQKIIFFIAISLLVHIFALLLSPYISFPSSGLSNKDEQIVVDLDPQLLEQMRQQNKASQIAESEVADNKIAPTTPAFLGERDQSVAEQTKARNAETFRTSRGNARQAGKAGQKTLSLKNLAAANDITPPTKEEMEAGDQSPTKQRKIAQAEAGNNGGELAPGTSDYLKNIKDGDRTMLNTKEFVYFSYFRRIRQQLEVAWNRNLSSVLAMHFQGGRQLASSQNYVTQLVVVLNRQGHITNVQLRSASGMKDLDKVAIDAFNQAGPFPDPPSGIVEADGYIRIPWDFIVQSG